MRGHKNAKQAILIAFCSLLAAAPAYADSENKAKPTASREREDTMLRHRLRDEINAGLVGIVAEGTDYTTDLAFTVAGEQDRVRLLPVAGAGALQNAKDVLFARGIDFGIVQTDVLDDIKRHPPFPGVEKYVQYVTKLYDQDLHVLAGSDVRSIGDLKGKKVNFGLRDSGTYTTAAAIFGALGVQPDVTTLPQPLALDKLRRGELSALVYVATKPSRLFQDIRPDENLHFLPVSGGLPSDYTAATIISEDYPELVSKDAPIDTVAVGTVLVVYKWPTDSERRRRVNRFVEAFFEHLNDIKARRPKWHDFDATASVAGWTRFPAAEQWLKRAGLIPELDNATEHAQIPLDREALFRQFAEYQRAREPGKAAAERQALFDPTQREALFREFADYQRTLKTNTGTAQLDPKQREALFREFAEYQKGRSVVIAYREASADH